MSRSQGGPPDIMVTNYSMLEYMMLRPLEHRFWYETKLWLDESPENKLLFVIDEAHLYEGAVGTEVSMLIQRLRNVIDVPMDKFQFILTSASLGGDEPEVVELSMNLFRHSSVQKSIKILLLCQKAFKSTLLIRLKTGRWMQNWFNSWRNVRLVVMKIGLTQRKKSSCLNNQAEPEVPEANWPEGSAAIWRQQVLHDVLNDSDIFRRFYSLLNNPNRVEPAMEDPKAGPENLAKSLIFLWVVKTMSI